MSCATHIKLLLVVQMLAFSTADCLLFKLNMKSVFAKYKQDDGVCSTFHQRRSEGVLVPLRSFRRLHHRTKIKNVKM